MALLYGHDELVAAWVAKQIGASELHGAKAIGVVRGDSLVAGIVLSAGVTGCDVRITAAGYGRWMSRALLRAAAPLAFGELGCRRATIIIKRTDSRARRAAARLGFREEGALRECFADGATGIAYGLTKNDCRWIGGK